MNDTLNQLYNRFYTPLSMAECKQEIEDCHWQLIERLEKTEVPTQLVSLLLWLLRSSTTGGRLQLSNGWIWQSGFGNGRCKISGNARTDDMPARVFFLPF